ncbi:MAG: filamentous hemagglutinin N-terminal domain-containing protein [Rhizobiales bacterium]|nr:filamentous hemagglutinin N-terminal domain-containing protein [Hyphomicrobiales bacterium]
MRQTTRDRAAMRCAVQMTLLASTALCGSVLLPAVSLADGALPSGGSVASGSATIASPSSSSLLIQQSSPTAIVNWDSFSIGAGNAVTFANGSGATLNRVTGLSASQIDGLLSGSGSVYLVNPSGIVVGPGGVVSTGGSFIASTLDVSDEEFNAQGAMTFKGGSKAAVINYGSIGALGGDVALIARRAVNEGSIDAPNGTVALAAGYEVLMRDGALSDGKFLVKVGGGDTEASTSGAIRAANVELRANGGNVYALAGNTGGVTKATGVANKGGRIFLTAGDGGAVKVTQNLSAKRITARGKAGGDIRISGGDVAIAAMLDAAGEADAGGTIVATGKGVSILASAKLDVSGALGGVILVGGDYQGGANADTKYLAETVETAETTSVAAGAVLDASGSAGAGGHVVVWSNQYTDFAGSIVATGSGSGAGGDAEVSGKAVLGFTGTVDLRSQSGVFGTLLLDPYNLTISDAPSTGMSGFNANADDSVLNVGTLEAALATANVKVTTGSGGSQTGDITVASNILWTSNSTLELSAYHDVIVDAEIQNGATGSLILRADNTGTGAGTVTFGPGGSFYSYGSGGVSIFYNPSSYANPTDYSSYVGAPFALAAYMLVNNVDQLQAMQTNLDGTYALGRDIDASATATWNGGSGFVPVGADLATTFNGVFDGQGHVIDGLTINRTGAFSGLFGITSQNSVVRNAGVTNVDLDVGFQSGAIAGINYGTIQNVYSSGSIDSSIFVGGLVGRNYGSIANSYSIASVKALSDAGGLAGQNQTSGTITTSYASGSVSTLGIPAGGIAGSNLGTISKSYWDKDSTGQSAAVGTNNGTITDVTGVDASNRYKQSTYANLDFTSQWFMADGYMRPILRSEYQTTITNVHQLQLVALDLSANYVLGADVDASATDGSDAADIWKAGGFTPLGNQQVPDFTGTFDGQDHVIKGLTITRSIGSNDGVALFGQIGAAGVVKNIGIVDADITSKYFGAPLAGYNDGLIENAYSTGTIKSDYSGGGLVSSNDGTITGSHSSANVVGVGYAGGFLSDNRGTITNSYATGSVNGDYELGGFAYLNRGSLTGVYATGDVTGDTEFDYGVGGLVGINDGSITNAYATGNVIGETEVGGLVGENTGTLTDVYATGDVTGESEVGGLVGLNTYDFFDQSIFGKITRAYATGKVTGSTKSAAWSAPAKVAPRSAPPTGTRRRPVRRSASATAAQPG